MPPAPATGCHMHMVVRLLLLLLRLNFPACALPVPIRLHLLLRLFLSLSPCARLTLAFLLPLLLLPLLLAVPALSSRFQPIWPAFLSLLPAMPSSKRALLLPMPVKVWAKHGRRCYSRLGQLTLAGQGGQFQWSCVLCCLHTLPHGSP